MSSAKKATSSLYTEREKRVIHYILTYCGIILSINLGFLEGISMGMNVVISRAAIKANAKSQMKLAKPHPVLVAMVYCIIIWVLNFLYNSIAGKFDAESAMYSFQVGQNGIPTIMHQYRQGEMGAAAWAISVALSLMTSILGLGFTIYALKVSRLENAGVGTIFDGFAIFLKFIGLIILESVFIILWSMLLIIPGIIASYRYAMATYIMIDNPDMSILDCIRESKRMMQGRKAELFILHLSFLGWSILSIIPFVSFWVLPYAAVTEANYYNALLGLEEQFGGFGGGQQNRRDPRQSYGGGQQNAGDDGRNKDRSNEKPPWEQ